MPRRSKDKGNASSVDATKADSRLRHDVEAALAAAAGSLAVVGDKLPDPMLMRSDIIVCLKDAITDELPVRRKEIDNDTKASTLAAVDLDGWAVCLATFAVYLQNWRPIYCFYDHKDRYTKETYEKNFAQIVDYLKIHVIAQFAGIEP